MLNIYQTQEDALIQLDEFEKGCWINLINPTIAELQRTAEETGIYEEFLRYPLDDEELPRVEAEDDQILIIINVPIYSQENELYETIPLGIILNDDYIVTVCLSEIHLVNEFTSSRVKGLATFKKTRFIFHLFSKKTNLYLKYLRDIDRRQENIEQQLRKVMKNDDLTYLSNLQKSLVYILTSLRANDKVMEKLLRTKSLKMYEEDEDLLEDVIIENKQAIEMAEIYSNISRNTMDNLASITNNNLSRIMNFLTIITIVVAVPTVITSFFGMNVPMPFASSRLTTVAIFIICSLSALICYYWLNKKKF